MVTAVQKVRDRLLRSTRALAEAGIPYAVVGDNAVASLVSEVDEAAVRNTQDVHIMLRREDLPKAKAALESSGFVYMYTSGLDMFLDGPGAKARDAVHILFANEKIRQEHEYPRMKLVSYRDKDRTHIRDFIGVGLVDANLVSKMPPLLAQRLQAILDNPEG
jgi:hypothetical protein